MIFGFGKKNQSASNADNDEDDDDVELISFQGALNGKSADMAANARLAQAGLIPAKEFVTDAIARRAEQLKLEIRGERAQSTLTIDGVSYAGDKYPKPQATAIIQMMKLLSGLDAKLRGKRQSGGLKADMSGIPWELLVNIEPTADGSEKMTIKARNLKVKMDTPDELGIPAAIKAAVRERTGKRGGVIVVCGPPSSGLTTLRFGILRCIDHYMHSVFSLADHGTRDIYNVTRFEANEGDDLVRTVERIIRSEADAIFLDPLTDPATAKSVFELAENVTMIVEVTAKDANHGVLQLQEWLGPELVAARLSLVISQRLVRILCKDCREAFRPSPKLLAQAGLPPETKVLYKKGEPTVDEKTGEESPPCGTCAGIGYLGRVAMFEMLQFNEAGVELLKKRPTADQLRTYSRAEGLLTLHKDGLRLVAEGKTSLEELQRVFKTA